MTSLHCVARHEQESKSWIPLVLSISDTSNVKYHRFRPPRAGMKLVIQLLTPIIGRG